MSKAQKKPARKKTANGYKMPEPVPKGEVLEDVNKKQWRVGPSIGKGGFGEIYSAQPANESKKAYLFVVKIEPHENGPLFVEQHFYFRCGKQSDINSFKSVNNLESLGMPSYIGTGSHVLNGTKYRFLVMDRFDKDVDKIWQENKGVLPKSSVFQLAWQIAFVLEYIHSMGYIHADIKGANILMGIGENSKQAYLVDFGLATKYDTSAKFKPNPKKAHDGTIEYLSRDAHQGVATRRGDLEILGYNMVHWLGGKLPWQNQLTDPKSVQKGKEEAWEDLGAFFKNAFNDSKPPNGLIKYFNYVETLEFNEKPDYEKIREIFEKEIKADKAQVGVVEFVAAAAAKKTPVKRKLAKSAEKVVEKVVKQTPIAKRTRRGAKSIDEEQQEEPKETNVKKADESMNKSMEGFTEEMKRIKKNLKAKSNAKVAKKRPGRKAATQNGVHDEL